MEGWGDGEHCCAPVSPPIAALYWGLFILNTPYLRFELHTLRYALKKI
jgi:hypothetical protein